jgi:hypothetical protein
LVVTGTTLVSGSSQILNGTTIHSGSFFNGITVVSGSAQVDVMSTTNIARLATTGSNTFQGNQTINGSMVITGSLTAQQFIVSSSVTYLTESFASGSHKFGDSSDDTHQFTGSVYVTGSFNVNASTLYVTGSNVGVGMTPVYKLDVSDAIRGLDIIAGGNTFSYDGTLRARNASNNTNVLLNSNGSSYLLGGNFGVGITTPATPIQILKDTNTNGTSIEEGNMAFTVLSASGQSKISIGACNAGNYGYVQVMQDATSWTNRNLSLQPRGGYVGVGTYTPNDSLDVYGSIRSSVNSTYYTRMTYSGGVMISQYTPVAETTDNFQFVINGASASTTGNAFVFKTQVGNTTPAEVFRITKNGSVGINNVSSPTTTLDVNGSVGHNNGGNYKSIEFFKSIAGSTSAANLYTVTVGSANTSVFYEVIVFGADWSGHSAARTIKRGFFCPNGSYTVHNVVESSGLYAANISLGYSQSSNAFTTTLTLDSGTVTLHCHIRIVGDISSYS